MKPEDLPEPKPTRLGVSAARCQYCGCYVNGILAQSQMITVAAGDEIDEREVYTCGRCNDEFDGGEG